MINPFKRHTQAQQPDLGKLLSEFNQSLMLIADKELLIRNFIAKIKQLCAVENVSVFLLDSNTGKYKWQTDRKTPARSFSGRGRLVSWLSVNERSLLLSENQAIFRYFTEEEQQLLLQMQAEFIYPLKVMNQISGIVILGKKSDGRGFAPQETDLLSLLFNQAAFAIEHASLYEMQSERIKKMYRTDRLATLGELAAGAAHEIRNPLTSIRSTIQYLNRDFRDDPVKSKLTEELITEVERINKIVQGLLSFARPSQLNRTDVNLEQLIHQTLLLLHASLRKQRVEVEFEYFTRQTTIQGDAEQLKQVFLNILLNAIEAMSRNDEGQPRTLIISIEPGTGIDSLTRYLLLSFEDSGTGIDEKDMESIFNPFFSTKEEGTGLGLAISYGIIHRHEGEIEVRSTPGKGTCFTLKIPQRIA